MTRYQTHIDDLCAERIGADEFLRRCKAEYIEENGPVPEGRHLLVGLAGDRLIVGHVEHNKDLAGNTVWKFKTLKGPDE